MLRRECRLQSELKLTWKFQPSCIQWKEKKGEACMASPVEPSVFVALYHITTIFHSHIISCNCSRLWVYSPWPHFTLPQDRWAADSRSTLTTAIIWETLRDLRCACREKKSPLCRSVLQLEWAAGRKLSINVSHLKSHLKNYIDLEVLPLLVLGTALKDALICFQLYCSKELQWQIGIAREEVV